MSRSIVQLLFNPDEFFTHAEDEAGLIQPILIVLSIGILGAISAYLTMSLVIALLPASQQGMAGLMLWIGMITAIAMAFIVWVAATAIFYGISALFGGTGTFRRLLIYTGLGSLPQVFGSIFSLYFLYAFVDSKNVTPVEDPMMIAKTIQELMSDPWMLLIQVTSLLFLLWSANIWIFGVKHARRLRTRDAVITVLVPIVAYLIYIMSTITGYIGGR